MADIVSPEVRSRMMSGIRGKNTRPELFIRKIMHAEGFRYRLHAKKLPGKPDLVFRKYKAAVLVHGCFWHGHNCHLFKWPSSRKEFWKIKIKKNCKNDERALVALKALGWRVLIVWECAIKGKERLVPQQITQRISNWLNSKNNYAVIKGCKNGLG